MSDKKDQDHTMADAQKNPDAAQGKSGKDAKKDPKAPKEEELVSSNPILTEFVCCRVKRTSN